MRETRNAQPSIFDFYSEHKESRLLESLSDLLDQQPEALLLVEQDFKLSGRNMRLIHASFINMVLSFLSIRYIEYSISRLNFQHRICRNF